MGSVMLNAKLQLVRSHMLILVYVEKPQFTIRRHNRSWFGSRLRLTFLFRQFFLLDRPILQCGITHAINAKKPASSWHRDLPRWWVSALLITSENDVQALEGDTGNAISVAK